MNNVDSSECQIFYCGNYFEGYNSKKLAGNILSFEKNSSVNHGSLRFALSPNNSGVVYLTPREIKKDNRQENETEPSSSIVYLSGTYTEQLPRLMNESYEIFYEFKEQLQVKNQSDPLAPRPELITASKKYRDVFTRCIIDIEDSLDSDDMDDTKHDINLLEHLKLIVALFHLVEIFFFSNHRSILATDIILWIHEHRLPLEICESEKVFNELITMAHPTSDSRYWHTIYQKVLTGKGVDAWQLLKMHPKRVESLKNSNSYVYESFVHLEQVVTYVDTILAHGNAAKSSNWRSWNNTCVDILSNDRFIKENSEFYILMKLLNACPETLRAHCNSWSALLAAELLLGQPATNATYFSALMIKCVQSYSHEMSHFVSADSLIMNIMDFDIKQVVIGISDLRMNWLSAHLIDLLTESGQLDNQPTDVLNTSLSEYFLLQYVSELCGVSGGWQIACGYLRYCPVYGESLLKEIISREKPSSDAKAWKLIQLCKSFHLKEERRAICTVRGMHWKQLGIYSTAALWFLRANNFEYVNTLCDRVLKTSLLNNSITELNVFVDSIASATNISNCECLLFVAKYRELLLVLEDCLAVHSELKSGNQNLPTLKESLRFVQEQAAKRIYDLLAWKSTPKVFWSSLLLKAIPLLELSPPTFSSNDTYLLINRVHFLETSNLYPLAKDFPIDFDRMRLTLSENLSRAIINELSAPQDDVQTL